MAVFSIWTHHQRCLHLHWYRCLPLSHDSPRDCCPLSREFSWVLVFKTFITLSGGGGGGGGRFTLHSLGECLLQFNFIKNKSGLKNSISFSNSYHLAWGCCGVQDLSLACINLTGLDRHRIYSAEKVFKLLSKLTIIPFLQNIDLFVTDPFVMKWSR